MSDNTAEIAQLRQDLIDKIDAQIEWRERKAQEYPNDTRNQQRADSLRRLHENIEALPADHALWFRYWNVFNGPGAPDEFFELAEIENESVRIYGFHGVEDGDAVKFLEEYVGELEARYLDVHDADDGERSH